MTANTHLDSSVVICAYTEKRWDDLVAAVKSVQQQSVLPGEIIVVIDYNPRLLERACTHMPGVMVIENSRQKGLSGARNSGIAAAQGGLIAFLDDDAVADSNWLTNLSNCCTDPNVLGSGGTVEPWWVGEQPRWLPREFYWVVGCTYQPISEKPVEIRNPFGGCMCVRREVFEAVGGFRTGVGRVDTNPMGCEETELCIRAKQHWPQKRFMHEPQARVHHRIPAHRTNWRYFLSRCYAEGLSKSMIAQYVGAKDSLSSEYTYTLQTLPLGILQGLLDGLLRFDSTGFLRATAIVVGFTTTAIGYLVGNVTQFPNPNKTIMYGVTSPRMKKAFSGEKKG